MRNKLSAALVLSVLSACFIAVPLREADAAGKNRIKSVPLTLSVFDEATAEIVNITANLRVLARCDVDPFANVAVSNAKAIGQSGRKYLYGGADFVEIMEPCQSGTVSVSASFYLIPRRARLQDACDASECIVNSVVTLVLTFDQQGLVTTAFATGPGGASPEAARALAIAMTFLGTPYKYGGSTPETGFDAAGLVQYAYAQVGVQLPRTTDAQFLFGIPVPAGGPLLPGDLVFFQDPTGYVDHVGMAIDSVRFIHAPHTGDVIKISQLSETYYAQRFAGARRIR